MRYEITGYLDGGVCSYLRKRDTQVQARQSFERAVADAKGPAYSVDRIVLCRIENGWHGEATREILEEWRRDDLDETTFTVEVLDKQGGELETRVFLTQDEAQNFYDSATMNSAAGWVTLYQNQVNEQVLKEWSAPRVHGYIVHSVNALNGTTRS